MMNLIAEVALSHEGSVGNATALIDLAASYGVNYIKFQDHWAEYESSCSEKFRIKFGNDSSRFSYWKRTSFSAEDWHYLKNYCKEKGILYSCSVFSPQSFLRQLQLGNRVWKIGSGEVFNEQLINVMVDNIDSSHLCIISLGIASFDEASPVIDKLSTVTNKIVIMDCISQYPCSLSDYDISRWKSIQERYPQYEFGLSDHSGSVWPTIFSWQYGAKWNEFHITFDKNMFGPDQKASLNPQDLCILSDSRRSYQSLLSTPPKNNRLYTSEMKEKFGRSLGVVSNLKAGHELGESDFLLRKPAGGDFSFADLASLVGKRLSKDIKFNQLLSKSHFND